MSKHDQDRGIKSISEIAKLLRSGVLGKASYEDIVRAARTNASGSHSGGSGQMDTGHFVGRQGSDQKPVAWAWVQRPSTQNPNLVPAEYWLMCGAPFGNGTGAIPAYDRPSSARQDVSLLLSMLPPEFEGGAQLTDLFIPAKRTAFCGRCNNWYSANFGIPNVNTNVGGPPPFGRKVLAAESIAPDLAATQLSVPVASNRTAGRLVADGVYAVIQPDSPGSEPNSRTEPVAWVWRTGLPSDADVSFDRDVWLLIRSDAVGKPFFHRPGKDNENITLRFVWQGQRPTGVAQDDFKNNPGDAIQGFHDWVYYGFPNARKPKPEDPTVEVSRLDLGNPSCLEHLRPWNSQT